MLPLWGCFKGEEGKRHHFLVMVEVTASGLEPRKWLDRIVARQKAQGLIWGPLFVDHEGRKVESELCNGIIIEVLKDCQAWETARVELNMQLLRGTDVANVHGSFRSFKRGAVTCALEAGVSATNVEVMGQWRSWKAAKGRRPGRSMREHHMEIVQLLDA